MRRTVSLAAAALALAATPIAAQAQNGAAKPAAGQSATDKAVANGEAKPTPEQLENFQRAIKIMRLFTEAFKSDKVNTAVKGRLIACLYANTLAKISDATGQVLKNSPTLDGEKPADLYRAAAGVCGIVFKKVEDKAASSDAKTSGR